MRAAKTHMDAKNDVITKLHTSHNICSLLSLERRSTTLSLRSNISIILPEKTLNDALNNVIQVVNEVCGEEKEERSEQSRLGEISRRRDKMNKIARYKELIQRANSIFVNYKRTSVSEDNSWGFSSFCYECGKSSGVRLTLCTGCEVVCYCSRNCKEESWKKGHREECVKAEVIRLKMSTYSRARRTPDGKREHRI